VSSPPVWLGPANVAAYLDLAGDPDADDNLVLATAAVKAAVERRRSDLRAGDPPTFTPSDEVRGGAIMWAALVYQARNAPSGYSGYGDETMIFDQMGARRGEIMRMLGWTRPVTA
jgi:hypothetical protein